MSECIDFFKEKKPWSKYKDLILDYYLGPYLHKVARITDRVTKKPLPIAVVDCFAGPGRFADGTDGSPLIIANHLRQLRLRGVAVQGVFIEKDPSLFASLEKNLLGCGIPSKALCGSLRDCIPQISKLASDHTVFLYVDPMKPGHLLFDDLELIYSKIYTGRSIETLVNFLTWGFCRRALGLQDRATVGCELQRDHQEVVECNKIAGGVYWQEIIRNASLEPREKVDAIADEYEKRLRRWFDWTLKYAVREKYEDDLPKYHLVFGSRHPDAVDLMNRAMVKARRKFVGARFIEGMLFPNQPEKEVVDAQKILQAVLRTARTVGKTRWKLLRAHVTVACPCDYTDSEINTAIKRAIKQEKLGSTSEAKKIDDKAEVWPIPAR